MKMHEDILRVENLSRIYGQGENEVCALDHVSFFPCGKGSLCP